MSKVVELDAAPAGGERIEVDRERAVTHVRVDAERNEHVVTLAEYGSDREIYADPAKHWAHLDAMTADGWTIQFERSLRIYLAFLFVPTPATTDEALRDAAAVAERLAAFWSNPGGWPSQDTIDALDGARLDWMASLVRGLSRRVDEARISPDDPGTLIVAWVHLRAITEGYIRLFLAVYNTDYRKSEHARKDNKGEPYMPGSRELTLECLLQFLDKECLFERHNGFFKKVQRYGNAIHPFSSRDIGTATEFEEHVRAFIPFLRELARSLPLPHHDDVIAWRPDVGSLSTRPLSERPPWDR
ncbi:hypothetical protein WMF38_33955 [Sorangium sp. So ce118]